jgi:hypothetical protein
MPHFDAYLRKKVIIINQDLYLEKFTRCPVNEEHGTYTSSSNTTTAAAAPHQCIFTHQLTRAYNEDNFFLGWLLVRPKRVALNHPVYKKGCDRRISSICFHKKFTVPRLAGKNERSAKHKIKIERGQTKEKSD